VLIVTLIQFVDHNFSSNCFQNNDKFNQLFMLIMSMLI